MTDTPRQPIPVILDTDIGTDIDDTWALIQLLRSPELDLRLVLCTGDDTHYRARLTAALLQLAGRPDIPIAIGPRYDHGVSNNNFQEPWLGDTDHVAAHAAAVYDEGACHAAVAQLLTELPACTVIGIGRASNTAAVVDLLDETVLRRHRFVGMFGSVHVGYAAGSEPAAEANVKCDPAGLRRVFAAPWGDILITPLDTCGRIYQMGEHYQRLLASDDPLVRGLLENYRIWAGLVSWMDVPDEWLTTQSSVLFDCVAVHLAFDESLWEIETLPIAVDDAGYTLIDENEGEPVRVAMVWRDRARFDEELCRRLLGQAG